MSRPLPCNRSIVFYFYSWERVWPVSLC